jgi:signal transduction histidine kinase
MLVQAIGASERTAAVQAMAFRHFVMKAWDQHALTRFASIIVVPGFTYLFVGAPWWTICAAFTFVAMCFELLSLRWIRHVETKLDGLTPTQMQRVTNRMVASIAFIVATYAAPFVVMAFSPGHGPIIGAIFCFGGVLAISAQHTLTRSMLIFTMPVMAIGLIANLWAIGEGWQSLGLGFLGLMFVINAIVLTIGSVRSSQELVSAKLEALGNAASLEARVLERTAELHLQTRRAEDANRIKSQFLANMSHELRTPLNAVIGYAELIEEEMALGDTQSVKDDLARIRTSANHLLGLINEVLDLSKIEAGKLELALDDVDVPLVARAAIEVILPLAAKNGVNCTLLVEPGVGWICTDRGRLSQCLLNLLANAAKFTKKGDILMRVRAREEGVVFEVHDTGIGISKAAQAELFEPFVQGDSSDTRAFEGTGLGLAITRRLARALGGDVSVESELGRGSVFTLSVANLVAAPTESARRLCA